MVSPLAVGVEKTWEKLLKGQSGLQSIDYFDASSYSCQIAGQVPRSASDDALEKGFYNPDLIVPARDRAIMDEFIVMALAATQEALDQAGWHPTDEEALERTGVMIGAGIGGLDRIAQTAVTLHEKGPRRVSPFFIPSCLINLASGQVSIKHGFKGPNHSVVTACATGAHAIGDAARLIMFGDADVMIAGGTEASICPLGIAGFGALRALATKYNHAPQEASRPWDQDRCGFVMGEGSGILILEEREHALKRGAPIIAEVAGYGMSGDAYHSTATAPDGNGGVRAMKSALRHAGLTPSDIDYINAHGTSTPLGDVSEITGIKALFQEALSTVSMSSTKSAIGHLLGAAGGVEAIFALLSIRDQVVPPTLNLENPIEEANGVDLVPNQAKERSVKTAMSNSFGFGGTNASVIFKKHA
jgi:3-oxoacyl-[acyl-carrier-protein] synthase II